MFDKFHLCDDAKIVTDSIPGKGSIRLLEEQERYENSNRSYPRSIPIAFDTAKGSIIQDVDGNQYIDFTSRCGVLNLGHNKVSHSSHFDWTGSMPSICATMTPTETGQGIISKRA